MPRNLKIILIALWTVVGLTVGGVTAGVWLYRHNQSASNRSGTTVDYDQAGPHRLDPMFDVPAFTLTDQDGKPFDSRQLAGKVWVADFIFTTCTSFCPIMTEQLGEFQKKTPGTGIQMVSFSVDPEHDTPAELTKYARINGADLARWHFLTGSKETLWNMSQQGMKLAVGPGDDHQVIHSSHFLLVDGQGHVRGVYDYKDAGYLDKLVADAKSLASVSH